jgi:hypothetical protein
MTRNWILCGSPAAFFAGLLMVHCSSSSTPAPLPDAGHSSSSSSSSSATSSSSTSASSVSSSSKTSSTGTSAGSSSSSGVKDAGPGLPDVNSQAGDQPDACVPTEGGKACSPGTVGCGTDASCAVPANFCCDTDTSETCVAAGGTCTGGTEISCNEAADCPTAGDICCILSTGLTKSSASVSCQPGPICPKSTTGETIASSQICRSDKECASGKCQFWSCAGNVLQTCEYPVPSDTNHTICTLDPGGK